MSQDLTDKDQDCFLWKSMDVKEVFKKHNYSREITRVAIYKISQPLIIYYRGPAESWHRSKNADGFVFSMLHC